MGSASNKEKCIVILCVAPSDIHAGTFVFRDYLGKAVGSFDLNLISIFICLT